MNRIRRAGGQRDMANARPIMGGMIEDHEAESWRPVRWTLRALYWFTVAVVSVTLVVGFLLLLESLDGASVGGIVRIFGS